MFLDASTIGLPQSVFLISEFLIPYGTSLYSLNALLTHVEASESVLVKPTPGSL